MTRGSVALAAALPAALLLPHLLAGGVPYFCDPVTQAQPYHVAYARELRRGLLPLFNPHALGGASFAGNVQVSLLYPPRLLAALLFGEQRALAALMALHLAAAAGAMALYARRAGASATASLIAAWSFGLGGFLAGKLSLPPVLLTASLLPLLLLALDELLDGRRSPVRLGIALALLLASGHPQTALAVIIYAAIYAALRLLPLELHVADRGSGWLLRAGATLFALVYASGAFALASFGQPVLHPARPALWLVALGVVALVASRRGSLRLAPSHERAAAARRLLGPLGGALFLGALLAAGVLLPVLENLAESRPPRRPDRLEKWAALDDRVALATDVALGHRRDAEASLFVGPVPLLLALLGLRGAASRRLLAHAAAAFALYVLACGPEPLRGLLGATPLLDMFPVLTRYLLGPAFALALLAGLGADRALAGLRGATRAARPLLVATVLLPLLAGAWPYLAWRSHGDLYPPLAGPVSGIASGGGRFLTVDRRPIHLGLAFSRPEVAALLMPNLGMVYEREDVQGYDPVHGWPIARLVAACARGLTAFPGRDAYHFAVVAPTEPALLRLLGVRHALVHARGLPPPGFRLVRQGAAGGLYELPGCLPRAFVPAAALVEPDADRAVRRIARLEDPARLALVPRPDALPSALPGSPLPLALRRPTPGRLVIASPGAELVVVTELYSRAWLASSAGRRLRTVLVDGLVTGILDAGGAREIELRYLPWGFRLGLFGSLAGAMGAVACVAALRSPR